MGIRARELFLLIIGCLLLCRSRCSSTPTFLRQGETLTYPDQLLSESEKFLLRFFDPNEYINSSRTQKVLLGLFYNSKKSSYPDPIWLADRDAKYVDGSANLTLGNDGSLRISYEGGRSLVLYSSQGLSNSSFVLQDDGNLVLREFSSDGSSVRDLWQSFDHPTDTLLPGMKVGFSSKTGKNLSLVSWRFEANDYTSVYKLGIDPKNINQLIIWRQGDIYTYWTSGAWEDGNFTSESALSTNENLNFEYVSNEDGTYFTFSTHGDLFNPRLTLDSFGILELLTSDPTDPINYLVYCSSNFYSDDGCWEKLPDCGETVPFKQHYDGSGRIMSNNGTKMSKDLNWVDCQHACDKNCSCIAFAFVNDTECSIWSQGTTFRNGSGDIRQMVYLKIKSPVLDDEDDGKKKWIILSFALGGAGLFITISSCCYLVARRWRKKAETRRKEKQLLQEIGGDALPSSTKKTTQEQKNQRELQIFSFKTIVSATKNFSGENQLGKGGYGTVYKGTLPDGQEIAIKRLSTSSGQGLVEFKKEAILIAKLQHTNLVRLLGFCVQGEEKVLVYEYMPNKSLDFFLFDSTRKKILDWKKRFIIIDGIAQGLIYLHKYSRLKVIHRDLKASNILLDLEMNPKISDFGMARLLGSGDSEENTNRIVGTFGYMPPEYALQGTVSVKTDVFSFGILLLEIVSGRKNNSRYHPDHPLNLTGYAWTLWKEGNGMELIDPSLDESVPRDEVMKCIQVGLLCVQDQASSRPTMVDVVFMLSTESAQLPLPRKPAFFISSITETQEEEGETRVEIFSINEMTISKLEVR